MVQCDTPEYRCTATKKAYSKQDELFEKPADFDDYFTAGVRSYGPGADADTYSVVDLHKDSNNHFDYCDHWRAHVNWRDTTHICHSVYRTQNGIVLE